MDFKNFKVMRPQVCPLMSVDEKSLPWLTWQHLSRDRLNASVFIPLRDPHAVHTYQGSSSENYDQDFDVRTRTDLQNHFSQVKPQLIYAACVENGEDYETYSVRCTYPSDLDGLIDRIIGEHRSGDE